MSTPRASVPPPASPAPSSVTTFIASSSPSTDLLAESLGARPVGGVPPPPDPGEDRGWGWDGDGFEALEAWRHDLDDLPPSDRLVVCTWTEPTEPAALADLDPMAWRAQVEWPTALWFTTVVAGAQRCRDGGSVVVVVERPATLDAVGRAPTVALADGLVNLVQSLAASEGGRGVRINAVTSRLHTRPGRLLGPPPPLATFPGRVEVEVVGAVRLLLSADAAGITGAVLAAGCGR